LQNLKNCKKTVDGEDLEGLNETLSFLKELQERVETVIQKEFSKSLDALVNDPTLTPGEKMRRYVQLVAPQSSDNGELVTSKVRG
jgi:hypothetical protein